ncbi:MAG TPA: HYR domain-containing protein [Gammaproteobacteria bacterium]|nr:HYR domain-containing protein [Gammaproteobacteria bacterium]
MRILTAKSLRALVILFFSICIASAATADDQIVTTNPSATSQVAGSEDISLSIEYATSPANTQTTGLGVSIYFDSTKLEFVSMAENSVLEDSLIGITGAPSDIAADDDNDDDDTATDKKATIAFTSFNGKFPPSSSWPADEAALSLATLVFRAADAGLVGTTTINYKLNTASGYTGIAESATIEFQADAVDPVITVVDDSITIEAEGPLTSEDSSQLTDFIAGMTAEDNLDGNLTGEIVYSVDGEVLSDPASFVLGTTVVDLSVTDSSSNVGTEQVTIIVVDTTVPTLSGLADVTFAATSADGIASDDALVEAFGNTIGATDLVDGDLSDSVVPTVDGQALPAFFPLGDTLLDVTVTDASGNIATGQLTLSVTDQDSPVVTPSAVDLEATVSGGYSGASDAITAAADATDNVDGSDLSVAITSALPDPIPFGETVVSITVTDAAGNESASTVTVTVDDTTAPEISGADSTIEGSAGEDLALADTQVQDWLASVTATDIVDGEVDVSNNAPAIFPFALGTTVTFTTVDAAGNQASADFVLSVDPDEVFPEITEPDAITVEAEGADGTPASNSSIAAFLVGASATDNVDGDVGSAVTTDAGDVFPLGETTVTFSIKDSSNNETTATSTVTVVDTTTPLISGVADGTFAAVDADGTPATDAGIEALGAAVSALDAVDGAVTVTSDKPEVLPLGATVVTVTATDAAGNTSTATMTITIIDQTPPVVTVTDIILEATGELGAETSEAALLAQVSSVDNVDGTGAVVSIALQSDVLGFGDTLLSVTVTDAAANASTASLVVSVVDSTAPVFSGTNQLIMTVDEEMDVPASDERVVAWLAGISAEDIVDGLTVVIDDVPEVFPVGETMVTFTSEDSRGNTATEFVSVIVAVGPAVMAPDAITVVAVDGVSVAASHPLIEAFLAAATAKDFSGNDLEVSDDAPESFEVGSTVVTFSATDSEARDGSNASTVTVVAPSADADTDGDGMDDQFEVDHDLNPNADDASEDADGDGRSNLDEYLEGKDPNVDDVDPVVTAPGDVVADSTGHKTQVDLGQATATDTLDGDLSASADNTGPFESGSHVITWTATDAAGNVGIDTQNLTINPQITTATQGRTAEGNTFDLDVVLNGPAGTYPLEIPFTLAGTAERDSDYSTEGDSVTIESGQKGVISFMILADESADEGDETIEVTLGAPTTGAVLGANDSSVISIIEEQAPPSLKISVTQGETIGRNVAAEGGIVTALLSIQDPNGDHTVDWSGSDSGLVSDTTDAIDFSFDPTGLAEGGYEIIVSVTDSGIADETFSVSVLVRVSAAAVESDSDEDGIPDSKDTSDEANVLSVNADESDAEMTADEGVKLVIGDAAAGGGVSGVAVSEETIAASGEDGGDAPDNGTDEDFDYPIGVYDFGVEELPVPGMSVNVVIPVGQAIPEDAVYRKYTEEGGWVDFIADDNNAVKSALGADDACPGAGDDAYIDGLTAGDMCLQLTLEDGGPNDADGQVNGAIDDPGGIAIAAPVLVVNINAEGHQNRRKVGGCSVAEGPGDYGLVLLALLALAGLARRRFRLLATRAD